MEILLSFIAKNVSIINIYLHISKKKQYLCSVKKTFKVILWIVAIILGIKLLAILGYIIYGMWLISYL